MLSVLIPIRDEYENLDKIESTFSKNLENINYEIILINDFSEDESLKKAQSISNYNKNFKVLDNQQKGLGGAINLGIKKSSGDYVCIMMADLSDDVNDLKKYYEIIKLKKLDAVFGSRFINGSKISDYPYKKLILNRIFNNIVKIFLYPKNLSLLNTAEPTNPLCPATKIFEYLFILFCMFQIIIFIYNQYFWQRKN